jgi:large subunit ribosomal protein L24e
MKCSYCQSEIEKGTGIMYVRKTGAIKYFCTKRCMKFDVKFKKKPNKKEVNEAMKKA